MTEQKSGSYTPCNRSPATRYMLAKTPIPPARKIPCSVMVQIKAALVPVQFCGAVLGLSDNEVMRMIYDGRLKWAWDLRRKNAKKAFVFVLSQSLYQAQNTTADSNPIQNDNESWEQTLDVILPHKKPLIKGSELVRTFSISSQHMMNLVNDGLLTALNVRRTRTATPVISRDSVIKFLKERRIL